MIFDSWTELVFRERNMARKKAAKKASKPTESSDNKAQAIRDYSNENPDDGPSAVAKALNAKYGWGISPQYVSTIKSGDRRRMGIRAKRGRPLGSTKEISVQKLKKAKQLAEELGGVQQARAALDALVDLMS